MLNMVNHNMTSGGSAFFLARFLVVSYDSKHILSPSSMPSQFTLAHIAPFGKTKSVNSSYTHTSRRMHEQSHCASLKRLLPGCSRLYPSYQASAQTHSPPLPLLDVSQASARSAGAQPGLGSTHVPPYQKLSLLRETSLQSCYFWNIPGLSVTRQ